MLERVRIKNFSLIRDAEIALQPGLTVLTGESGAGKTLLFDAIAFAMGGKPHRSILAKGADNCEVELALQITDGQATQLGAPWRAGPNAFLRRFSASGRSKQEVNGQALTAAQLQTAGEQLFEITGQFESRVLYNSHAHLGLVDAFGSKALARQREAYQSAFQQFRELRSRLQALTETAANRAQEIDYLTFQVRELAQAAVQAGERAEVEASLRLFEHAEALVAATTEAGRRLAGDETVQGAYDQAAHAQTQLLDAARLLGDAALGAADPARLAERLELAMDELQDLARACRAMAEGISHDPQEISRLQGRLDELLRLERKYRLPADGLPALLAEKQARLVFLTDATQSPAELERSLASAEEHCRQLAAELSQERAKAAQVLLKTTAKYFARLDFPQVNLEIDLQSEGELTAAGRDTVEILISLNPGEPARPLAQVASGGEASRLLLGVKAALAHKLPQRTMLLDEIEAGLGGRSAQHVARVMAELAETHQVLAISHLPVVAAQADTHLAAAKRIAQGRTHVQILPLPPAARRQELARMLGGSGTAEESALVDQLLSEKSYR